MKQIYFPTLLLCLLNAGLLSAQNPGCDGVRYKADVFTGVKKTTVEYAPTIGQTGFPLNLSMDVYEPIGDNLSARPVVILEHGGSFIFGDKSLMQPYCELLARKGYVAASIQYRLFPFFLLGIPDSFDIMDTAVKAVGDMKAAVRYFREDAATANLFHADPANIFIGGYSAGAVAALHTAYLDDNDVLPAFIETLLVNNGGLEGSSGTTSNFTYSSESKAVVNMSGGLYRREWINAPGIPMVSIHGTADATVPYLSGLAANIAYLEGSGLLHPQAEAAGVWNNLLTVPGGGHTDIYGQPQFAAQLAEFWVNATDLLESLTCQIVLVQLPISLASPDNMVVYPNPATANGTAIMLPAPMKIADVTILDATGRVILTRKNYRSQEKLELKGLPNGVYSVQVMDVENPENGMAAKPLLIQN